MCACVHSGEVMNNMNKIGNCPFCGGRAALGTDFDDPCEGNLIVFVKCRTCGARAKAFSIDKDPQTTGNWETSQCIDAIEAWNLRRADSEFEVLMRDAISAIADLKELAVPLLKKSEEPNVETQDGTEDAEDVMIFEAGESE